MYTDINKVLGFISGYRVFDVIPLDWLLHFLFGLFWYLFTYRYKKSFAVSIFFLFLIALSKELYDYFFHYRTFLREYLLDITFTLLFPLVAQHLMKKRMTNDQ